MTVKPARFCRKVLGDCQRSLSLAKLYSCGPPKAGKKGVEIVKLIVGLITLKNHKMTICNYYAGKYYIESAQADNLRLIHINQDQRLNWPPETIFHI